MKNILFTLALLNACAPYSFASTEERTETTYFISGEHGHPDPRATYVIPISDPEHIAHARELIVNHKNGELGLANIAVAEIKLGHANMNGDYRDGTISPHKWHVSEFRAFAEITPPLYSGAPEFVNSSISNQEAGSYLDLESGLGYISFSGYTIIEELPFPAYEIRDAGIKVSWIGNIIDFDRPWVNHESFGMIYPKRPNYEDYWLWIENEQSWFFTNKDLFPYMYSVKDSSWCYSADHQPPHTYWLYVFETGEWRQGVLNSAMIETWNRSVEHL